jgi:hypothetical protein
MFTTGKEFYLGCEFSYKNEKGVQQNTTKVAHILGILNNTFKPTLVQKSSRIKVYNALTLPILLGGREIWTLRKADNKMIDINRDEIFQKNSRVHPS